MLPDLLGLRLAKTRDFVKVVSVLAVLAVLGACPGRPQRGEPVAPLPGERPGGDPASYSAEDGPRPGLALLRSLPADDPRHVASAHQRRKEER